jgi:hypothetical protein
MPQKGAYGTLLYAISEVRDQLEQWVEELKEPLNILRALSISEHPSIRNRAQSKIESTQAEMEALEFFLSRDTVESYNLAQLRNSIPIHVKEAQELLREDEDLTIYRRIEVAVQRSPLSETANMDIQQVRAYSTRLSLEAGESCEETTAYTMLLEALSGCHAPSEAVLSLYCECLQLIAKGRSTQVLPEKRLSICIDFIDQHDPYRDEYPSERRDQEME